MPDGARSKERGCKLGLALSRYGSVHTWYDAKVGLRQQLVLLGQVNDPYLAEDSPDVSAPHFHGKPVRFTIVSPNPNWLDEIRARREVDHACGYASIKAAVKPESVELDGEFHEIEPVDVVVAVNADAFEAIHRQAAEANQRRRIMHADVVLVGNSLPEIADDLTIWLKDLDISVDRSYAISGFEIFETRFERSPDEKT